MPNGAQIFAHVRPHVSYSVASLVIKVGSAFDPPSREGTAHLLEHLLPLQPKEGTTVQIALEHQGFLLSPETGRDFMAFHLQGLHENLDQVLPKVLILADELQVEPNVVEREKRLMWLETLALYEDPLWLMKTLVEAKLFEGTSYAHPPMGWLETIKNLSLDDALLFHRTHFCAPNMVLIAVVGDGRVLPTLKEIASQLPSPQSDLPKTKLSSTVDFSPQIENLLQRKLHQLRDSFWGIGWRIKLEAREKIAADATVAYLRQSVLPVLFGRLGVVREWNLVANPIKGELALTIVAYLRPYTELVEVRLSQTLEQMAQSGLTKNELAWLKRILSIEHFRTFVSPNRLAREMGLAWAIYDNPLIFEGYGETVEGLNAEDVRQIFVRLVSSRPVKIVVRK